MTTLICDFQDIVGKKIDGYATLTAGKVRPSYDSPSLVVHNPTKQRVDAGQTTFVNVNPGEAVITLEWDEQSATIRFVVPESDDAVYLSDCLSGEYLDPDELELLRWSIQNQLSGAREILETAKNLGLTEINGSTEAYFTEAAEILRKALEAALLAEQSLETIDDKVAGTEGVVTDVDEAKQKIQDLLDELATLEEELGGTNADLAGAVDTINTLSPQVDAAAQAASAATQKAQQAVAELNTVQGANAAEFIEIKKDLDSATQTAKQATDAVAQTNQQLGLEVQRILGEVAVSLDTANEATNQARIANDNLETYQYQLGEIQQEQAHIIGQQAEIVGSFDNQIAEIERLSTEISTAASELDTISGEQSALVEDMNKKVGSLNELTATQGAAINAAKQVADTANTKADTAQSTVDNLQIGGRNLVVHTGEIPNSVLSLSGAIMAQARHSVMMDFIPVTPGEILTFTKTGADTTTHWRYNWYGEDREFISRRPDSRKEFQWVVPSGAHFIRVSYPDDEYPKLERGNKATDWTPSPEDVAAGIDKAQTEAETARAEATSKSDAARVAAELYAKEQAEAAQADAEVEAARAALEIAQREAKAAKDAAAEDATQKANAARTAAETLAKAEAKAAKEAAEATAALDASTKANNAKEAAEAKAATLATAAKDAAATALTGYKNLNDPKVSKAQQDATKGINAAAAAKSAADQAALDATNKSAAAKTAAEAYAKEQAEAAQALAEENAAAEALRVAQAEATAARNAAATDAQAKADEAERLAKIHADAQAKSAKEGAEATAAKDAATKADNARIAAEANAKVLSDKAQQAATAAQESIDNLEIGGRNLVKNPDVWERMQGGNTTPVEYSPYHYRVTVPTISGAFLYGAGPGSGERVRSVEVRTLDENFVGQEIQWQYSGSDYSVSRVTLSNEWQRLVSKPITSGVMGLRVIGGTAPATVELRYLQIEHGNKATDWTPAPEDITASVAKAQAEAETARAEATSKSNAARVAAELVAKELSEQAQADAEVEAARVALEIAQREAKAAKDAAATDATTKANAAQTAAENLARLEANAARETAEANAAIEAQKKADKAKEDAESTADTLATAAKNAAATALSTYKGQNDPKVTKAQKDASSGITKADTAQKRADKGVTDAATALARANEANNKLPAITADVSAAAQTALDAVNALPGIRTDISTAKKQADKGISDAGVAKSAADETARQLGSLTYPNNSLIPIDPATGDPVWAGKFDKSGEGTWLVAGSPHIVPAETPHISVVKGQVYRGVVRLRADGTNKQFSIRIRGAGSEVSISPRYQNIPVADLPAGAIRKDWAGLSQYGVSAEWETWVCDFTLPETIEAVRVGYVYSGGGGHVEVSSMEIFPALPSKAEVADAKSTADTARTEATNKANQALQDATAALTSYQKVNDPKVSTAQNTASTAKSAADTAKQVADKGVADAAEAKSAVDNLEIGGRNLVIRTGELKGWLDGSGNHTNTSGHFVMRDHIPVTPGETLTFTKQGTGFFRWNWYDAEQNYVNRKPDDRNEFQWAVPSNVHNIWVSYPEDSFPQIERGNKATDWTPAPEDVDAGISEAKTEAETARAEAESKANQARQDAATALGSYQKANDPKVTAAKNTADTAKTRADKGVQDAATAKTAADTAKQRADKGVNDAATAKSAADVAKQQADQGVADAAAVRDAVRTLDTRSVENPPSYYWAKYPMSPVREFTRENTLGISNTTTYINLETTVPWTDHSGGAIVQRATRGAGSGKTRVLTRTSIGSRDTAYWSTWVNEMDDLNTKIGDLNTKAGELTTGLSNAATQEQYNTLNTELWGGQGAINKLQGEINANNSTFQTWQKTINDQQKKWNDASTNATAALARFAITQSEWNTLSSKATNANTKAIASHAALFEGQQTWNKVAAAAIETQADFATKQIEWNAVQKRVNDNFQDWQNAAKEMLTDTGKFQVLQKQFNSDQKKWNATQLLVNDSQKGINALNTKTGQANTQAIAAHQRILELAYPSPMSLVPMVPGGVNTGTSANPVYEEMPTWLSASTRYAVQGDPAMTDKRSARYNTVSVVRPDSTTVPVNVSEIGFSLWVYASTAGSHMVVTLCDENGKRCLAETKIPEGPFKGTIPGKNGSILGGYLFDTRKTVTIPGAKWIKVEGTAKLDPGTTAIRVEEIYFNLSPGTIALQYLTELQIWPLIPSQASVDKAQNDALSALNRFAVNQADWNKTSKEATDALREANAAQLELSKKRGDWEKGANLAINNLQSTSTKFKQWTDGATLAIDNLQTTSTKFKQWTDGATLAIDNLQDFKAQQLKWNTASEEAQEALEAVVGSKDSSNGSLVAQLTNLSNSTNNQFVGVTETLEDLNQNNWMVNYWSSSSNADWFGDTHFTTTKNSNGSVEIRATGTWIGECVVTAVRHDRGTNTAYQWQWGVDGAKREYTLPSPGTASNQYVASYVIHYRVKPGTAINKTYNRDDYSATQRAWDTLAIHTVENKAPISATFKVGWDATDYESSYGIRIRIGGTSDPNTGTVIAVDGPRTKVGPRTVLGNGYRTMLITVNNYSVNAGTAVRFEAYTNRGLSAGRKIRDSQANIHYTY